MSADELTADESRTLRIECDAARTRLALALFASLDAQAQATVTIEQSHDLSAAINVLHQEAGSWLRSVFR